MSTMFDEKAGTVDAHTPNYDWTQTIDEVRVQVPVPEGTRGRDLEVLIKSDHLKVKLKAQTTALVEGPLFAKVKAKDSIWTLEDNKVVNIVLSKSIAHQSWKALIQGEHELDPFTADQMEKKMLLERFQGEHPGFDFSGAEFSGQLPQDPKNFMKFE
ncbi:NudC domain-containing protein 2 [Balamuthia mandrillaris]